MALAVWLGRETKQVGILPTRSGQLSTKEGFLTPYRITAIIAVCVAALALAGAAFGHDCIRVSASLNGLQQSAGSGNWLLFDLSSGGAVKNKCSLMCSGRSSRTLRRIAWRRSMARRSCRSRSLSGSALLDLNGVLAGNNKNTNVLGNNKGIDHLDDSPILPAVFAAGATCGVDIPEEG